MIEKDDKCEIDKYPHNEDNNKNNDNGYNKWQFNWYFLIGYNSCRIISFGDAFDFMTKGKCVHLEEKINITITKKINNDYGDRDWIFDYVEDGSYIKENFANDTRIIKENHIVATCSGYNDLFEEKFNHFNGGISPRNV